MDPGQEGVHEPPLTLSKLPQKGTKHLRLMEISQFCWIPVEKIQEDSDDSSFDARVRNYRKRLRERRRTRGILNNCGLKEEWLRNKSDKTQLESRVLKQMLLKGRPEIIIKKVILFDM